MVSTFNYTVIPKIRRWARYWSWAEYPRTSGYLGTSSDMYSAMWPTVLSEMVYSMDRTYVATLKRKGSFVTEEDGRA